MNYSATSCAITPGFLVIAVSLLSADVTVPGGGQYDNLSKTGSGAAIYEYQSAYFSGTSSFSNNMVQGVSDGGAVNACNITQNAASTCSGNKATEGNGGAIYSRGDVTLGSLSRYASNAAKYNGGAICFDTNDSESPRIITINAGTQFTDNMAGGYGGAIFVSGLSGEKPTTLNLISATSSRTILFSGNTSGVIFNSSFSPQPGTGVPNAMAIMAHVNVVMQTNQNCEIIFDDPIYSLKRYSASSSIEKMGAGSLRFRNYVSSCRFPVSIKQGSIIFENGGAIAGATSFTASDGTVVDIEARADIPAIEAETIAFASSTSLKVNLPAEVPVSSAIWPLMKAVNMDVPNSLAPVYGSGLENWTSQGSLSLARRTEGGTGLTVISLVWTPHSAFGPYDDWTTGAFPPETPAEQKQKGSNPSGDGINNLTKYALGLDPLTKCASPGEISTVTIGNETYLRVEYPCNTDASDIEFYGERLEFPLDAHSDWTTEDVTTSIQDGKVRIQSNIPIGRSSRQFLRLKMTVINN